ncbi:MAG: hypothetical protein LAN84_02385 [Acidobacteriia bacterium]|nr:hypothetical protein [Terriglobia bacterium]
MARPRTFLCGALALLSLAAATARPQEVVDRLAARIESDVILLSEVRQLGAYQQLLDGKRESDAQLLDRLIDQWIVRTEAEASRFPRPAAAEVEREVEKLKKALPAGQPFGEALREADLRSLIAEQLYLSAYLDSRFRPAVQVEPQAIDDYYATTLVPLARSRGETPPPLESVRESIRELLIQRGINEQADRWLKERRARLHVEKEMA